MNGKHYIGKRVSHIEKYDETAPISGVALLLDENNQFLAGDQNGFVLDITCPYGTQAMASDILAKLRGHTYKGFRADNAPLPIDSELGDGVTVDGLYSVLAYRSVKFGPGHFSDIAAPGENELRHEYNYLTPTEKLQRKIATTNSRITKTAEEIMLEVSNEIEGLGSSIDIKLSSITSRVADAEDNISTLTQTAKGLDFQVNNKDGKFSKLSIDVAGIKTTIGDESSGLISEINQKVGSINLSVSALDSNKQASIELTVDGEKQTGQINLSGLVSFTNLATSGQTLINGGNIMTNTISADSIDLKGAISFSDLSDYNDVNNEIASAKSNANIAVRDARNIAAGLFHSKDPNAQTFIDGTGIYSPEIYSPNIHTNKLNLYAENNGVSSLSLYSKYNNEQWEMLSFKYYYGISLDPYVKISSPVDGIIKFSGKIDFSEATVTGL